MTITHLNTVLAALRAVEALGDMPASAMAHTQKAIERIERKIAKLA